ncbi:12048_t:CDS:2, partial [Racocetra persica]
MDLEKDDDTIAQIAQLEGVGATVRRCISGRNTIDPFLMCDIFEVSPPAGFPDHPHRGFETVTYMLEGYIYVYLYLEMGTETRNYKLRGIQWMTAGRGIVHAEMPITKSKGIQLWINLSAKNKMIEPSFQNLSDEKIPRANPEEEIEVKVIAGSSFGVKSNVFTRTPTMMLDFKLSKGKKVEQEIPKDYQGFIYVWEGSAYFGGNRFNGQENYALFLDGNNGDYLPVDAADDNVRFMLFAGQPLKEPIVSYGPFVMNTEEEIFQTMSDYN